MKQVLLSFFTVAIISAIGCKKSGTTSQSDCQAKNYGTYRLNFSSGSVRHHVIVVIGFGVQEKDFETGVLTDTMHVTAGTYSVFITSNNGGPAIDQETTSAVITQCTETVKSVSF